MTDKYHKLFTLATLIGIVSFGMFGGCSAYTGVVSSKAIVPELDTNAAVIVGPRTTASDAFEQLAGLRERPARVVFVGNFRPDFTAVLKRIDGDKTIKVASFVFLDFVPVAGDAQLVKNLCVTNRVADLRFQLVRITSGFREMLPPECLAKLHYLSIEMNHPNDKMLLEIIKSWRQGEPPRTVEFHGVAQPDRLAKALLRGPAPDVVSLRPFPSSGIVRRLSRSGIIVVQ